MRHLYWKIHQLLQQPNGKNVNFHLHKVFVLGICHFSEQNRQHPQGLGLCEPDKYQIKQQCILMVRRVPSPGIHVYKYICNERELNLSKTTYALHVCRCPCGNVLKPKHEIPKPESIQNIQSKQEYSTSHYLWKRTAIPSPSSNPELLHFFLEPLVRRSTALMSANCTRTRTQLLTVERGYYHFAESRASRAAMHLRKACMDWWAIPSTVTIKGQKVARRSSAAALYLLTFSRAEVLRAFW